jgi:predicted enzyme related to lactoylglutathione lyase
MSEVTGRYSVRTPCWVDMTVNNQKKAKNFYRAVFGWEFVATQWHYDKAFVRGKAVAAISEGDPEGQSNWTTYSPPTMST